MLVGSENFHKLSKVLLRHVRPKSSMVLAVDHDGQWAVLRAFSEESHFANRLRGMYCSPELRAGDGKAPESAADVRDALDEKV